MDHTNASNFILTLLHSATNAHLMHFQTKSFSVHKTLNEFYDEIVGLVDDYTEAYQGCYGVIEEYANGYHPVEEPVKYFKSLKQFVETFRKELPDRTSLQNIIDEIDSLILETIYKLENLK